VLLAHELHICAQRDGHEVRQRRAVLAARPHHSRVAGLRQALGGDALGLVDAARELPCPNVAVCHDEPACPDVTVVLVEARLTLHRTSDAPPRCLPPSARLGRAREPCRSRVGRKLPTLARWPPCRPPTWSSSLRASVPSASPPRRCACAVPRACPIRLELWPWASPVA